MDIKYYTRTKVKYPVNTATSQRTKDSNEKVGHMARL